ncbi:MAG: DUF4143 domain-containing protein, partial [Candidatus Fonsibacter sp.]
KINNISKIIDVFVANIYNWIHKYFNNFYDGIYITDSDFKIIGLDCGLVQNLISANNESLYVSDFSSGLITEQFVGQELRVYVDPYDLRRLYYWFNDAKNASAEIDYLIEVGKHIIPVEV